jgi:small GTP-binding protein
MVKKVSEYVSQHDYMFRICIVGDANVGKTSLLTRYCDGVFKEAYNNTIGVDFRVITHQYKNIFSKIHIWDTAGQERFKSISVNYFRSTHGFMFVYDVTQKNSLHNLNSWIEMAFSNNKSSVVNFLVGNKIDLENRQVSVEEGKDFAAARKFTYIETSAKATTNVDKAFEFFTYKLIDYYSKNKKAYENFSKSQDDKLKIEEMSRISDINTGKTKKKCAC